MANISKPAQVFAPGEILREELEARDWTAVEFAQILGRPEQTISQILNDRKEITPSTALEFAHALGTSAEFWLNLQASYQLSMAKASDEAARSDVQRRARMRELVPVREMQQKGWLPNTDRVDVLETAVCELLGISSLDGEPRFIAAARRRQTAEPFTPEQNAWLARVSSLARAAEVAEYDSDRLGSLARRLPQLLAGPQEAAHLGDWLADVGVVLVVEPGLRGSKIDGAVWMRQDPTPVIGLTTRGDRFDGFVFTLLHEIAHLVLGHVESDEVRVEVDLEFTGSDDEREEAANRLASSWIFPDGLVVEGPIKSSTIVRLAEAHAVHPSLVIGRLQHDGLLGWNRFRNHIPHVRSHVTSEQP